MYEQIEKPKESNRSAVANSVAQAKSNGKQGFGFVDNRPMSFAKKNVPTFTNNSSSQTIQKKENNIRAKKDDIGSINQIRPTYKHSEIQIKTIQRSMWYDPKTGKYIRYKKQKGRQVKVEGSYTDKNINKLLALHQIADEIEVKANADSAKLGPHIAVSIVSKKTYVAINERFSGNNKADDPNLIRKWALEGISTWLNKFSTGNNHVPANIFSWVYNAKDNIDVVQSKSKNEPKKPAEHGAWHGEIAIAKKIRNDLSHKQGKQKLAPRPGLQKVIHIGGTKTNCLSCFVLLHGQLDLALNKIGGSHGHSHKPKKTVGNFDKIAGGEIINSSLQDQLPTKDGKEYKFLTGGTHGGLFPGANHLDGDDDPNSVTNQFSKHLSNQLALTRDNITQYVKASTAFQSETPNKYDVKLSIDGALGIRQEISDIQDRLAKLDKQRNGLIGKSQGLKGKKAVHIQGQLRSLKGKIAILKNDLQPYASLYPKMKAFTKEEREALEAINHIVVNIQKTDIKRENLIRITNGKLKKSKRSHIQNQLRGLKQQITMFKNILNPYRLKFPDLVPSVP